MVPSVNPVVALDSPDRLLEPVVETIQWTSPRDRMYQLNVRFPDAPHFSARRASPVCVQSFILTFMRRSMSPVTELAAESGVEAQAIPVVRITVTVDGAAAPRLAAMLPRLRLRTLTLICPLG